MKRTSIEANKVHFDWIDSEQREKGKYSVTYNKIIDGTETEITEITVIGNDYVILNFERNYNPAIKFVPIA